MAIVNPFSNPCAPSIRLVGGQVCNLLVPPSPIIKQKFGPFVVDYECHYACQNPAGFHVLKHRRFLFFFQWSLDDDDD